MPHKTCMLQNFKVLRYRRLGNPESDLDFTDTHGLMLKDFQKLYTVRVGQSLHDPDKIFHGHVLLIYSKVRI
jgi:hypothetical protein